MINKKKLSHLLVGHFFGDQAFDQVQPPRVGADRHVDSRRAVDGPALQFRAAHRDRVPQPVERILESFHCDAELAAADGAEAGAQKRHSDGDVVPGDAVREG